MSSFKFNVKIPMFSPLTVWPLVLFFPMRMAAFFFIPTLTLMLASLGVRMRTVAV